MKTKVLLILYSLIITLYSCQNSMDEYIEQNIPRTSANTRSNINKPWIECKECILKSGKKVLSPWANSISTTVPDDIRTEISVENHWEILYTNVDIIGYDETVTNADEGLNYILFYNQYTGVLKGFLYIESYVNSNNNAYWLLSIDGGTKLFNFVPEFAKPLDSTESPYQISISAITKNGLTQGFEQGWNCFMVELAYDENSMNEQLSISGYALNESTYEFTGAYNSTSEGTIVTSTNDSSNPIEGIANAFGNAGKNWINNNIGSDASKPIKIIIGGISSLIEKGISGFISAGLNLIFNSVVGSTHTSYDLQFSTNGKITVTGKSSQPSSGMIKPIAGVPLDGLGKRLGVWNLKTVPEYNVNAPLQLKGWTQNTSGKLFYVYNVFFQPTYQTVTNPDLDANVHYSLTPVRVTLNAEEIISTYDISTDYNNYGVYIPKGTSLYIDNATEVENKSNNCIVYSTKLPNRTYQANIPALLFQDCKFDVRDHIAFRVLATIRKEGEVKSYSGKSFVPIHSYTNQTARPNNWTFTDIQNAGYGYVTIEDVQLATSQSCEIDCLKISL